MIIAPSVLSANFLNLERDIEMINNSEADWFHVDIMDGVFVPNISFGMPVMAALQKTAKKTLDVHLMLINPENGKIVQTISASNFQNNDWEDVAKSEAFLFLGDMGNNEGERKNLAIHVIPIKDINKNSTTIKSIGTINFYYPEQNEFDVSKKHNFDCEAILYHNQQIYLFTKNRLDDKTNLYALPAKPGNYAAKLIGSFEVGGRITGADISDDGKKIALLGYNKKSDCFLWTFNGFTGDNFFTGKSQKYTLGQYAHVGQMEGVAFKDNSSVFISSEEIANVFARLYLFKLD